MRFRSSMGYVLLSVVAIAALTACGSDARPEPQAVTTSTQVAGAQPAAPVENVPSTSPVAGEPGISDGSGPMDASVAPPTAVSAPAQPVVVEPPRQDPVEPQSPPSSNPDGDDLAATIMGDWQRHASKLHLDPDPASSTFTTGANCCDVETWTATYTPIGNDKEDGVVVTLLERTFLVGDGLGGTLYAGKRFEASPSVGYNDTRVLMTYDLGDAPGVNTWCRSGHSVPECGA